MIDVWWNASRATGIVAAVLMVMSVATGLSFSARNTGRRRPAWSLDFHNGLGVLTLWFTVAHVVTAYLSTSSRLGLVNLVVPGTIRWPATWGVVALYLVVAPVLTTWPRRLRRPTLWRAIHAGSVVGVLAAGVHTFQAGTDQAAALARLGFLVATGVVVYGVVVRVLARRGSREGDRVPSTASDVVRPRALSRPLAHEESR